MIEVTHIDHMGSDLSVVNAARVSFGKESVFKDECFNCGGLALRKYPGIDLYGCRECYIDIPAERLILEDRDAKLIRYLAKHNHKSPFNHTFATFRVKAPVFVARQLVKHEYMPWNEISRRYVDDEPEFYTPPVWRGRSADKKQGSDGTVDLDKHWDDIPDDGDYPMPSLAHQDALYCYRELLRAGVCPEQARMVLPQSMMTEWYWSGSLFAFAKMCGLRLKDDTQYETRVVAEKIEDKMMKLFPVSWEALRMYAE